MIIFPKLNIEFNEDLKFNTEMQLIFGVGRKNNLYKKYGYTKKALLGLINIQKSEYHIESFLLKNRLVSYPLKQFIKENITRKIILKLYTGMRHQKGLSVRGQRTHSNCKTVRFAYRNIVEGFVKKEPATRLKFNKRKKNKLKSVKKNEKKPKPQIKKKKK